MTDSSRRHYVVVIDEDAALRREIRDTLKRHGLDVHEAATIEAARLALGKQLPDAVVLDIGGASTDSLGFLRELRSVERTRHLPVVVLSAAAGSTKIVRAMRLGASDFLGKPFEMEVLAAKLEVHLRYRDLVVRLERRNELLARLAALDELTGLYNRRSLLEALPLEIARAGRVKSPLALMLIDADHFKRVNDTLGHIVGDETLQALARRLETGMREADVLARYGGEEFCAVVPRIEKAAVDEAAERMRRTVAQEPLQLPDGTEVPLTVSVGVVWMPPELAPECSPRRLLRGADEALYEAKTTGRNKVCSRDLDKINDTQSEIAPRGERTPPPPDSR